MVIKIDADFKIGQVVYLKTDPDQLARLVRYIKMYEKDIVYGVIMETDMTEHFGYEISEYRDLGLTGMN